MNAVMEPFTANDLSMQFDADHWFPFVENEDANITGYGHQDKAEFASAVNRYDDLCGNELTETCSPWVAKDIAHKYAVRVTEEKCTVYLPERKNLLGGKVPVTESTPGAFPITTLWNQR